MSEAQRIHLRQVIAGDKIAPETLARLRTVCRDDVMKARLATGSESLYSDIFKGPRASGCGRVRSFLEDHQAQALDLLDTIDDIKKVVYYELVLAGFDLAAVAGNEFVLLIPNHVGCADEFLTKKAKEAQAIAEQTLAHFLERVPARCRISPRHEW